MRNRSKKSKSKEFGDWVQDNYIPLSMMYFEYFTAVCNDEDEGKIVTLGGFVGSVWNELKDEDALSEGRNWQKAIDLAIERSRNEIMKVDWSKN